MISSVVIAALAVFVIGAGILIALLVRASGERQSAGTIARVLYDAEHPETLR